MHSLLLWDFDGVVVDSVDECLLTSYNAFLKHQKIAREFIKNKEDIPISHRKEFYRTRHYVRQAGGYFTLIKAIYMNKKVKNNDIFRRLFREDAGDVRDYEKEFFSMRAQLREKNSQYWFDLHRPYAWVKDAWNELNEHFNFYVVSNKDALSIALILQHFSLPAENHTIFGKEYSLDKKIIIKHIISEAKVDIKKISFIDDNYYDLVNVRELGIRLFYASWGYGKPADGVHRDIHFVDKKNFVRELLKK